MTDEAVRAETVRSAVRAFCAGVTEAKTLDTMIAASTATVCEMTIPDVGVVRLVYVPAGATDPSKPDTVAQTAARLERARAELKAAQDAHAASSVTASSDGT